MGTHLWSASLWLVLLAAVATHSAAGPGVCPQDCSKTSSVFHYQDGKKYIYSLEGITTTILPGTQGDVSKLQLKATVELGIKSACSHVLRIKNLQVIGPDEKKYALKDLEANPVVANFQGGLINDQICTVKDESQAALNIKRAVLSLLQSSAPSGSGSSTIREVDIFGICPTDITYSKSGDTTTIKKSRNLNLCAHREDLKQEFLSTPFVGNADLQSIPLLESTQTVEQIIKKGILQSAISQESYLYRPFAKQSSGARTTVQTKLQLTSEKVQPPSGIDNVDVPRSIIFEAVHETSLKSNKQTIIAALRAAQESMPDTVGPEAARRFQALVGVLRQSSKDDILSVYKEVKAGAGFSNKEAARKVLLDALFKTGTGDSVGVAVELIRKNEISGYYSKLWYSGFAFVRHATLSSVTAVSSLLDNQDLPREALLGIGSLVGRYCREHSCENVQQVNELISKLAKRLNTKISSRDDENKVIAALKALHNIHHLNNAVADTLQKIASDHSVPARVRVAALDTYHSDACRPKLKKSAWEILNNRDEDSEIRIKAYLVLVECPCGTVANNLKELLENEPVNQVGSFIVSHLRNLRASASPAKADAKQHLGLLRSRKHYPEDVRKFSRNYEISYILEALNIGTTVESNVIFSQSSYVPRSVSLNLTTDLFGHSYNILEIDTRTENADRLLEAYLGPKGYLNTHSLAEIYKNARDILTRYGDKIRERLQKVARHRRSINRADLDRIRNEVIQSLPPSPGSELIVDLSVKLFGAEVAWLNSDHDTRDLSPDGIINTIFDCLDGALEKAKKFNHHVKQHWTFLDSELTYPTGAGLPLKLTVSGSTAVHLKLAGQIDVQALINDPKNAAVQLELVPSAAVEVTADILVDAIAVEAGLKVAYTLHTATGANIDVKILDGTGIDVSFGLPLKNQDILTLKTEVLRTVHESGHSEVDTPLAFTVSKKEYHGCFDQIKELTGLTVCADVVIPYDSLASPSALYPLNGPSLLSVRIESTDVSSYHLRSYYNNKDPKHRTFELLIDTPGSSTPRRLALNIDGKTEPNKEITISLSSPWKSVTVQGILVDTNTEQSLTAKLVSDDIEYALKAGVKVSGDASHQTYTPLLEYKYPEQKSTKKGKSSQVYNVQGSVTVDRTGTSRKYTFNDVTLNSPYGRYKVDGTVSKDSNMLATDVKVSWDDKYIVLKSKLQKVGETHYKASLDVVPSMQRDLSIGIRWEYERKSDEIRNELVVIHGQDLKTDQTRVTLSQYIHYTIESATNFDISTRNSLTYPILNIEVKLDGAATPKNVDYNLLVNYDIYRVASELHAKTGLKKTGDYDILFVGQVLNNTLRLTSKRDIVAEDKSKFVNVLELIPIAKYELDALVTHQYQRNNINQQIDAVLKIDSKPNEYKADVGFILNPQQFDTHTKLSVGSDKILDASTAIKRDINNPAGDFKLYIKSYVDASASFHYGTNGGKATLNIDIPKLPRKIQGNADLVIQGSKYNGDVILKWNADVDPKDQLTFQTVNDVTGDSIESKNTLIILDYKTVLNLKGALTGKLQDGHLIGNGELILPNGRQITLKIDRNLQIRSVSEGQLEIELTDSVTKGGQPRKLLLEAKASNVDPKVASFQGDGKLEYKTAGGKDIKLVVSALSNPQGDNRRIGGQVHIDGSLVPDPLELQFSSDISKPVVTYKANGGYGSNIKGSVSGSVKTGIDGSSPREIDNTIEVGLPGETLKNLKLHNSLSLLIQKDVPFEVKSSNLISWNNDNTLKIDGQAQANYQTGEGSAKAVVTLPKEKPRSIALLWSVPKSDNTDEIKRAGSATFHWDGDKEAKVSGEVIIHKGAEKSVVIKLISTTPYERLQSLDLLVTSKLTDEIVETNGVLTINDQKTTVDSKIGRHGSIPFIDVVIVHPKGTSKLYVNPEKLEKDHIKGQFIWQCVLFGGWSIVSDIDIQPSVDNPKVRIEIDAPKFKVDKWLIEAGQKGTKTGAKQLFFSIKSQDKILVSGRSSLRHKEDGLSETFDGSGTIEVGDKGSQRFSYHIIRKILTEEANKETGIEYSVRVEAGQRKIESSLKSTNREVGFTGKSCVKEHCSNVDVGSKLLVGGLNDLTQEIRLIIDLKDFEVPLGIAFREHTIRQGWNLDHEADLQLHYSSHQTAYNTRALINSNGAVVNITLPKRVLSIELATVLKGDASNGETDITLLLWWDRVNKPSLHTVASLVLQQKNDKNGLQLSGRGRFNNPSLERELGVNSYLLLGGPTKYVDTSVEVDIFKKANQKIIFTMSSAKINLPEGINISTSVELRSKGQNLEIIAYGNTVASTSLLSYHVFGSYKTSKSPKPREGVLLFEISKEKLNVLVKVTDHELLAVDGSAKIGSNLPSEANMEITVIGLPALVVQTTAQKRGLIAVTTTVYRKGTPNKKLVLSGGIEDGVYLRAEVIKQSERKSLVNVHVSGKDDDFLKTDFSYSAENIKQLIEAVRQDLEELLKKVRDTLTSIIDNLREEGVAILNNLKKSLPDIPRFLGVAEEQLKEIRNELENDEVLKDVTQNLKEAAGGALKTLEEAARLIANTINAIIKALTEIQHALVEGVKKASPSVTKLINSIINSAANILETILKEGSQFLSKVIEILKKYEPEIQKLVGTFSELIHDVSQVVGSGLQKIIDEISDFTKIFIDELKELPIYNIVKEKYAELIEFLSKIELPTGIWNMAEELIDLVKGSLPNTELQELITTIEEYIAKHVKKEPVDDRAELQKIYQKLVKAIKSIIVAVQKELTGDQPSAGFLGYKVPISLEALSQLPRLLVIRLSPVAYLASDDFPRLVDLYYTYKPTLNPLDWIPPFRATGILIESNNFITFDGRHYTFKGSCSYVLAQDYIDGNFSLVVTLEDGKLKAITLSDNSDSVELTADKRLKVNGADVEYPIHQGEIAAWRRYHSVNLRSKAGVYVHCHTAFDICTFRVSGFYHGRTRGLLGTLDNEQYDDLLLPSGKVAPTSQFANSWKLDGQCADVPVTDVPSDSSTKECSDVFGGQTVIRTCYPFVNPSIYRDACNDAVSQSEHKIETACTYASAYIELCQAETNLPVFLPQVCRKLPSAQCNVIGGSKLSEGETATVKSHKAADIVVVVEQVLGNAEVFKNLVTPLISTLNKDLKNKGIGDVKYSLIGYGAPGQKWPSHLTSNGEIGFGDKNIKFLESEPIPKVPLDSKHFLEWLLAGKDTIVQRTRQIEAFMEAGQYPFRAGAAKAIIGVISTPCAETNLVSQIRINLMKNPLPHYGINLHLITPIEDLTLGPKDQGKVSSIVAFDNDAVYTTDKKRDTNLRNTLDYKPNVCAYFTQAANGVVYVSNNFLKTKGSEKKQFVNTVSSRITSSIAGVELTEECVCILRYGVHPETQCIVTSRKEKEVQAKGKGVKG